IGSRVPPAVTSTRSPSSARLRRSARSISASSSGGSGRRPTPASPSEASGPVPGSSTIAPRSRSRARLAWVAGCSYIAAFIAGATIRGRRDASAAAVSRLSAWPPASLAIVFALAGAIAYTSARSTSSRWPIGACAGTGSPGKAPRSGSSSHSVVSTGAPVMPANDAAPTKRAAFGVWTTRTAWPALIASRVSSSALYAAIPPVTPIRMRAMARCGSVAAVAVLDLAARDLFEGDGQVVLRAGVHHRRRELLEGPLAEVVVVGVDLPRPLGGDDHACVWGVDVLQQAVDAG